MSKYNANIYNLLHLQSLGISPPGRAWPCRGRMPGRGGPECHARPSSRRPTQGERLALYFRGLLSLLGLILGWSLLNRALSPWRAVGLHKTLLPEGPQGDFAGRLRIGAYNIAHGRGAFSKLWKTLGKETILEQVKKIAQLLPRRQPGHCRAE